MTVSDPVADMLTRLRNGNLARMPQVEMPSSRMKEQIARVLLEEGFIGSYDVQSQGPKRTLRIVFKVRSDNQRPLGGLRRISRPGLRVYARKTEIPRVLGGLGTAILSTPAGVVSGREAWKSGQGGEVLAYVW